MQSSVPSLSDLPAAVLEAYQLQPESLRRIPSLINHTYLGLNRGHIPVVVQRLHPVFAPEINWNILRVTRRLKQLGLATPELLATQEGAWWLEVAGHVWRVQTYVEGVVLQQVPDPALAFHAGRLVATFHGALWDWPCVWQGLRSGVHDTPAHLSRLAQTLATARAVRDDETVHLGEAIAQLAHDTAPSFQGLPLRSCHGDLKISNLLFQGHEQGYPEGRCLIDLDTLGPQLLAYELGDALRSWCNSAGEDATRAQFHVDHFQAALEGYLSVAPTSLLAAELDSVVPGLITICLELAARFCVDVVEDRYFGWDATRFSCRREHNLARAKNQLDLARAVHNERPRLQQFIARAQRQLGRTASRDP